MILEGIVTTRNQDGETNIAPMGPLTDPSMQTLRLRPFQTSRTYQNLKRQPQGVFHVTDDVLLLARTAIGRLPQTPLSFPAQEVDGNVLHAACRWYEFEITEFDDSRDRTSLLARVVHAGRIRDFFGFNRAKHAVLEAAILATRVHILPRAEIEAQWETLKSPVEKTAGPDEQAAFELLTDYVTECFSQSGADSLSGATNLSTEA